jgi:hypothetical protein
MGIITKVYTYVTGTVVDPAKANANEDLLYTTINGGLDADNLADDCVTEDQMSDSVSTVVAFDEAFADFVVTGLAVVAGGIGSLACTLSGGTCRVSGKRHVVTATGHTVDDNVTTYCNISSSGVVSWDAGMSGLTLGKIVATAGTTVATDLRTLKPVTNSEIQALSLFDIDSAKVTTTPATTTSATVVTLLSVDITNVKDGDSILLFLSGSFSGGAALVANLGFKAAAQIGDEFPYDIEVASKYKTITPMALYPVTADAATLTITATWRTSTNTLTAAVGTALYALRIRPTG